MPALSLSAHHGSSISERPELAESYILLEAGDPIAMEQVDGTGFTADRQVGLAITTPVEHGHVAFVMGGVYERAIGFGEGNGTFVPRIAIGADVGQKESLVVR